MQDTPNPTPTPHPASDVPLEARKIEALRRFARKLSKDSRQTRRRDQFLTSLDEITKRYRGEPRKARRKIARGIMRRFWQEVKENAGRSQDR